MTQRRASRRAALAVLATVALGAGGCSVARPVFTFGNGSVSECFRALPVAKGALHDPHARLLGVKRVPADMIEKRFPGSAANISNDTVVCAFAFKGSFSPGQVDGAPRREQGPYAVVLVTSVHLRLVHGFVGAKLPAHFGNHLP